MGEYAELHMEYAARNMRDPFRKVDGRNAKTGRCPICGKGIRPIKGEIRASLAMHIKAKHPAIENLRTESGE